MRSRLPDLEALGERDDRHPRADVLGHLLQRVAEAVGGHAHHHHVGARRRASSMSLERPQVGVEVVAGEVALVAVRRVDRLGQLGVAGPQHGRAVVGGQVGDGASPTSRPRPPRPSSAWRRTVVGSPPRRFGPVTTVVLVPIKAFGAAKARLDGALPDDERAELARTLAATVLAAATPLPVLVVCDDDEVAAFASGARRRGAPAAGAGPERGRERGGRPTSPTVASIASSSPTPTCPAPVASSSSPSWPTGLPRAPSCWCPTATATAPTSSSSLSAWASRSPTARAPSPPTGPRPTASASRSSSSTIPTSAGTSTPPRTSPGSGAQAGSELGRRA